MKYAFELQIFTGWDGCLMKDATVPDRAHLGVWRRLKGAPLSPSIILPFPSLPSAHRVGLCPSDRQHRRCMVCHFFSIHLVWHLGLLAYVVLSINSLVTEVWALRKACSQIWQRSAVWWSKENTVGTFSKFLMFSFCVNWQSTAVSVSDSGDWTWTGGERHPTMTASWVQRHWKYVSSAAAHWDINFSKWLGGGQDNLLFWGHSSEPPLVSF